MRLMTVHGAKGQEFPAVVFADCANRGGSGQPAVLVSQDGLRVGMRCRPEGLDLVSGFAYEELCEEDKALGDDEERRITYVAMTRAQAAPARGGAGVLAGGRHPRMGRADGVDRRVAPRRPAARRR